MNDPGLRMTAADRNRKQDEPAFVLHSYPFRETSLILDVYSRSYGRLSIVARGARRPKSGLRGVLMNFQPLLLSWFGKGEVRTLHSAEWQGGQPYLQGTALMCGFYLNELLLNLLARDDPHEQLFEYYRATLYRLAHETDHAGTLRSFEKHLLQELGMHWCWNAKQSVARRYKRNSAIVMSLNGVLCRIRMMQAPACRCWARHCWTWRRMNMPTRSPRNRANN